jgi:hypothetical protein
MQAIVPAILADRIVCLTPLSADADERNLFSETKALRTNSCASLGGFRRSNIVKRCRLIPLCLCVR